MSDIQSDIAEQTKKKKNIPHTEEKRINSPKPTENRHRWQN